MLVTVTDLKEALGIPLDEVNSVRDATLNMSLATANALIAGYIGIDLSDTDTEHVYTTVLGRADHVSLPAFPILEIVAVSGNGVALDFSGWFLNARLGILEFANGIGIFNNDRYGYRITVVYRAGYEEIPEPLKMVCLNIAGAIYNLGGSFATTSATGGGTGELKSLTMFDAMSMSFDTSASANTAAEDAPGTPQALLKMWAFILGPYRVVAPAMK